MCLALLGVNKLRHLERESESQKIWEWSGVGGRKDLFYFSLFYNNYYYYYNKTSKVWY